MPEEQIDEEIVPGALIQELTPDILDTFNRLLELLESPEEGKILAPMLIRELHYRILRGPFGKQLRAIHSLNTETNKIAQAISWIKDNFDKPLYVDELASTVHMATSTFHRNFKDITTLSPLQYQKRLRLIEAQRLMLKRHCGVKEASYAVGYESTTQFCREYKRQFGEPPSKDIEQLRSKAFASTWSDMV